MLPLLPLNIEDHRESTNLTTAKILVILRIKVHVSIYNSVPSTLYMYRHLQRRL